MTVEPFRAEDSAVFLKMAAAEGWVAEPWEFAYLLAVFPEGCFCMRDSEGNAIAFVTSLQHDKSGWIGNLIVAEEYRGRGRGEELFKAAHEALKAAGAETFWLTASESGRTLYEKHGFSVVDTIVRWSGSGRQRHAGHPWRTNSVEFLSSLSYVDFQAWGDRRETLLAVTAGRGRVLQDVSGILVLQPCGAAMQFGPFSALDSRSAESLCDAALASVPRGTRICIDAPLSNRSAMRLFRRRGMRITGSTELMYAGVRPAYQAGLLYGLATMGSCG